MGKGIVKCFLIFEKVISKKDLIEIKKYITEVEKDFSVDDNRQINLDPGYVNEHELVSNTESINNQDTIDNPVDNQF